MLRFVHNKACPNICQLAVGNDFRQTFREKSNRIEFILTNKQKIENLVIAVTFCLATVTRIFSSHWRIYTQNFPAHAPFPYGTKFFHFHTHFHQKASVLQVHAPPKNGTTHPPTGNLGSALVYVFDMAE